MYSFLKAFLVLMKMSRVLSKILCICSRKTQVRTWGRLTCFLPRVPSNLVTPPGLHKRAGQMILWNKVEGPGSQRCSSVLVVRVYYVSKINSLPGNRKTAVVCQVPLEKPTHSEWQHVKRIGLQAM